MIKYIEIEGYKSIQHMQLELKPINVLIGSNGAGKSNFVSFFKMLDAIYNQNLRQFVVREKADNILHFGREYTEYMFGKMIFKNDDSSLNNAFWFALKQDNVGGLYIDQEAYGYDVSRKDNYNNYFTSQHLTESAISTMSGFRYTYINRYLNEIQVYHFHDTSSTSKLRRACDINDNHFLKSDGRNLPAFLYYLQVRHPKLFKRIVKTIQSIAPYIDKFILEPNRLNPHDIELRWKEKSDANSNFGAYQFSDGTLRFIALATVLMQPEPPSVIVIDEPELGLHPKAITKLAALIKMASKKTQLIISTQSVNLVDSFESEDIVTVDRNKEKNQSVFNRLNAQKLEE